MTATSSARGEVGTIWFSDIHNAFEYHNEPTKTKEAYNANGWTTIGDVGYLDAEGFLYLTDRPELHYYYWRCQCVPRRKLKTS